MLQKIIFVLVFSLFSISNGFGGNAPEIACKTTTTLGNTTVDVTVYKMPIRGLRIYEYAQSLWGVAGAFSESDRITSSIEVKINNDLVFIPFSSYADLGNIENVCPVFRSDEYIILELTGGGECMRYHARLYFNSRGLAYRTVHDPLWSETWEETAYSFPSPDDWN